MEDSTQETANIAQITPRRALLLIVGLTWLAYFMMNGFDTTTELIPDHGETLGWCFVVGGFGAAIAAALVLVQWRKLVLAQRIVWPLCAALIGFLTLFLFSSTLTKLIENRIDFPAAQTETFDGFLLISRAYWTHGKGQSWNIQTMPVWSNMEITQADYNFMLSHRPAGQNAADKDEITSKGFFCAHVTLQRTDKALRVLHAGRSKLPEGTVVVCPRVSQ